MQRLVTSEQMRALERAAEERGTSTAVLMERAGEALAQAALRLARPDATFAVICGRGNNGGDGLVAARTLFAEGHRVEVRMVGGSEGLSGDAARNLGALTALGVRVDNFGSLLELVEGDVAIDALFGTGLSRPPAGEHAEAIGWITSNRGRGVHIVSADVPSGIDADTGRSLGTCVHADATVTFGSIKVGLAQEPAASFCGALERVDIGLPDFDAAGVGGQQAFLIDENDIRQRLTPRPHDSNKGTFGHLLVIAGSKGKTGAAALSAIAALRSGVGLVTVAARANALPAIQAFAPELMGVELGKDRALSAADLDALDDAAKKKSALVIGPGIPRGAHTGELIRALLDRIAVPCVLDADALNAFEGRVDSLKDTRAAKVLTPHPGEMGRLAGKSVAEVQSARFEAAREIAARANAVVVLKGARTIIAAPDGRAFVNPTGNAGMATGGTGDVLSGILGALLAQGLAPLDAAIVAVFVHGKAGDLAAAEWGQRGLIASDLFRGLGRIWHEWSL